ncbi:hypothetical protein XBI1_1050007 [Xenorhabdus bovienii str. Intermedium]|uniref:Insecticidal toxin complex n=2 Tax=Xenorhabdus bovienii TaxID=40576 RepID=A0A077QEU3_XENBV|nr:hypothetical protein XBI1_1050007 [Xenorhabdus bovienii str. Intermedium]
MGNIGQQSTLLPTPSLIDSSTYSNYSRTYNYDRGDNLTQIRHSAPASDNSYTTKMTVSNRSNRAVLSTLTENPAEVDVLFTAGGQQNQLQPGQDLVWTLRGELLKVAPVVRDRQVSDQEFYRYDADSQRIIKTHVQQTANSSQTQSTLYLPGLERHTTTNGTTVKEVLHVITIGEAGRAQVRVLHWENGKPGAISNDQVRYSYDNLIGSSGLEVDGDGQIISMEEYYPYGGTAVWTVRNQTEAGYKTVRYSGKERDATGLYYYGYRYYQPWAGRWLSADPAGTIDGLNLFRMVRNNPLKYYDNNGLNPVDNAYSHMFNNGTIWKKDGEDGNGIEDFNSMEYISQKNMGELKNNLGKLNDEEINFLKNIKSIKFSALHATTAELDNGVILSRKTLKNKNLDFNEENTQIWDLEFVATDDFVFFSLEAGDSVQKKDSRFGNYAYLTEINDKSDNFFSKGFIALHDPAAPMSGAGAYEDYIERKFPSLNKATYTELGHSIVKDKGYQVYNSSHLIGDNGEELKNFLGLRLIKDIRSINNAKDRASFLSMGDAKDIGRLINTFYRPQLLIPSRVNLRGNYKKTTITHRPD